ncbi:hypothetical protein B0T24DRAFT_687992 [Lasiosphaeria ovina]|uniref:Uncharacterized protein n=1 Tax=Lasiosphaeria ovina TaxID=92902 RepID=A0AAE0NL51_9PEZI|nr:hypothetical protein B0T24DRAFT_687992 [Lasiosphaeria ovina]
MERQVHRKDVLRVKSDRTRAPALPPTDKRAAASRKHLGHAGRGFRQYSEVAPHPEIAPGEDTSQTAPKTDPEPAPRPAERKPSIDVEEIGSGPYRAVSRNSSTVRESASNLPKIDPDVMQVIHEYKDINGVDPRRSKHMDKFLEETGINIPKLRAERLRDARKGSAPLEEEAESEHVVPAKPTGFSGLVSYGVVPYKTKDTEPLSSASNKTAKRKDTDNQRALVVPGSSTAWASDGVTSIATARHPRFLLPLPPPPSRARGAAGEASSDTSSYLADAESEAESEKHRA